MATATTTDMEQLYAERLKRYVTAMRNEKPDRVPIRPFVAEFTAQYAGYTVQEVTHDYQKAFAAARKCAADFDWDAVVGNMVYVWSGPDAGHRAEVLRHARRRHPAGHRLPVPRTARGPGLDAGRRVRPVDRGPHRLPVQRLAAARGRGRGAAGPAEHACATTCRSSRAAWRCWTTSWASARRPSCCGRSRARSRPSRASSRRRSTSSPTSSAATRGCAWTCSRQPDKVVAACEAMAPHLLHVALSGADPAGNVPVGLWMHRGCVPFLSPRPVREVLLAHAQVDHRGALEGAGTRRSSTPRATGTATWSTSPSCPSGASCSTSTAATSGAVPGDAGREVLPVRRPAQRPAGLRHARAGEGLLQEADRPDGPRRRLHHGRRRHHAGRAQGGEPPGDDRGHAGVRGLLTRGMKDEGLKG